MVENFKWLLRQEEIDFTKRKYKGQLAGQAYKYAMNIDGLIRTRILIFLMSVLVLYRVLANYLFHEVFDINFLVERIVFAVIILTGGLLFNKYRVFSIILASVPLLLITCTYLFIPAMFHLRTFGFMLGITLMILFGIYNHFQAKKIKRQLEDSEYIIDLNKG